MSERLSFIEDLIAGTSPTNGKGRFENLYKVLKETIESQVPVRLTAEIRIYVDRRRVLRDVCYWLSLLYAKEGNREMALRYLEEAKELYRDLDRSRDRAGPGELRWLHTGAITWLQFTSMTEDDMDRNIRQMIR